MKYTDFNSCFQVRMHHILVSFFSRQVYVRKFGGFTMSQNDWRSQYYKLRSDLKKEGAKFRDNKEFSHLSYDSPWTMKNRRNEIWVEVEE